MKAEEVKPAPAAATMNKHTKDEEDGDLLDDIMGDDGEEPVANGAAHGGEDGLLDDLMDD